MFKFYKIIENIAHGDFSHVKLSLVDAVSKDIVEDDVKLKIGTKLEDDNSNTFRVNGYFGEYLVLRPNKLKTHPTGLYLLCKI